VTHEVMIDSCFNLLLHNAPANWPKILRDFGQSVVDSLPKQEHVHEFCDECDLSDFQMVALKATLSNTRHDFKTACADARSIANEMLKQVKREREEKKNSDTKGA
jgi:GTP1/Obg family GTP-binding protein